LKRILKALLAVALMVSVVLLSSSFVAAHPLDYNRWTWKSSTTSLRIRVFPTASLYHQRISRAAFNWNYISSEIQILSVTTSSLDLPIEIHGKSFSGTKMGECLIYSVDSKGNYKLEISHTYTGQVAKAKIYLDNDDQGLVNCSYAEQEKVITHELGHAFALTHPVCGAYALMQQGFGPLGALTIQSHDKSCLKMKWGN